MSSVFPGSFFADAPSSNTSFHPLFRLLDDFAEHSARNAPDSELRRSSTRAMKTFTPKFDVKEVAGAYELHGELPGIEQKDVEIEFTDIQTITVRGRTERSYTSGTPPATLEGSAPQAQIEGAADKTTASHKATVEDAGDEGVLVNKPEAAVAVKKAEAAPKQPEAKYWVSERSVGEFSRSFTFPVRVDQDAVKASMKNGVLSIVVPKAKKPEARKITIS